MLNLNFQVRFVAIAVMAFCSTVDAQIQYQSLDDAAIAQAKAWQSGEKARPLMSSDGKILFPFGQTMPKLTCAPMRACDVEMEPGETPKTVIVGDKINWDWAPAESIERSKVIKHIVFQPRDKDVQTNVIVTTDRRTYHIKLVSPKNEGDYLNRVGFYYPEDLVAEWSSKADVQRAALDKEKALMVTPAIAPQKFAFDYTIEGQADFSPLRVFNDGERVYIEMPTTLSSGEYPVLMLLDETGKGMVVNYRQDGDATTGTIHYIVDKLFANAELHRGTEVVKIAWKRKQKSNSWFSTNSSPNHKN